MSEGTSWKILQLVISATVAGLLWWNQNLFTMVQEANQQRSEFIVTVYSDFVKNSALNHMESNLLKRFDNVEANLRAIQNKLIENNK